MQFFEALGLEPRLTIDPDDLQKRFHERSRDWHPDRFTRAPAEEQQRALDRTALINDAYRTLRDPLKRAEYVLSANGFEIGEQRGKDVPPELLEEVFELNMALEELRGGDAASKPALADARQRFDGMRAAIDAQLGSFFRDYDRGRERGVLQQIRAALNRRRYIENLVREVDEELAAHAD